MTVPLTTLSPAERAAYARGMADTLELAETVGALMPALVPAGEHEAVTLQQLAEALARIDARSLRILRPYDPAEGITTKQAAGIAGRSESAVRQWCDRFRIGRTVVGSLVVSRVALAALLDDNPLALAAYLSGDRAGPLVAPYLGVGALQAATGARLK